MNVIRKFSLLFLLINLWHFANAQTKQPFWDEIQNFKKQDSLHFPPKNAILFYGSSSFRKWTDIQDYFPKYKIINRGFGGSTFPDAMLYTNNIVLPYHPKQIFLYFGDNDLAFSDTVSAKTVFNRFQQLFNILRSKLPLTSIVFVSIKPSPSRKQLMPKMSAANDMIKKFLAKKTNTGFADVYHKMLNADGTPIDSIFLEDKLHMTAKGYKIWQKEIQPFLLK